MIENGSKCIVISGNKDNPKNADKGLIDMAIFTELWKLGASSDMSAYIFTPGEQKNLADPKFYTVMQRNESGDKKYMRVPVTGLNKNASEFNTKLRKYLKNKPY